MTAIGDTSRPSSGRSSQRFIDDAPNQFAGSDLATQAATLLTACWMRRGSDSTGAAALNSTRAIAAPDPDPARHRCQPAVHAGRDLAAARAGPPAVLTARLVRFAATSENKMPTTSDRRASPCRASSGSATLLPALSRPVSVQPANPIASRAHDRVDVRDARRHDAAADRRLNPVAAPTRVRRVGKGAARAHPAPPVRDAREGRSVRQQSPRRLDVRSEQADQTFTPASIANSWGDLLKSRGLTSLVRHRARRRLRQNRGRLLGRRSRASQFRCGSHDRRV